MSCSLCGKFGYAAAYCDRSGCPRTGHLETFQHTSLTPPTKSRSSKPNKSSKEVQYSWELLAQSLLDGIAKGIEERAIKEQERSELNDKDRHEMSTITTGYKATAIRHGSTNTFIKGLGLCAGLITATIGGLTIVPAIYDMYLDSKYPSISAYRYVNQNHYFGSIYYGMSRREETSRRLARSACSFNIHNCRQIGHIPSGIEACVATTYDTAGGAYRIKYFYGQNNENINNLILHNSNGYVYEGQNYEFRCNSEHMETHMQNLASNFRSYITQLREAAEDVPPTPPEEPSVVIQEFSVDDNESQSRPQLAIEPASVRHYFTVSASVLNIRSGPGISHRLVGQAINGSCVFAEQDARRQGSFIEIGAETRRGTQLTGYVSQRYLVPIRDQNACVASLR